MLILEAEVVLGFF
ncbi:hypothetical protein ECCB7326_2996, partial [Escherichia coli CB7326]